MPHDVRDNPFNFTHGETSIMCMLRSQAWERAKGELASMLVTFERGNRREGQYDELRAEIEKFVQKVEDDGLVE